MPQLGAALGHFIVFSLAPAGPGFYPLPWWGGACFPLLVSLTVETILRGLNDYLKTVLPGGDAIVLVLFFLFDLAVIVLLFALIFRYLSDAKIASSG
jgi:hypothetical protein